MHIDYPGFIRGHRPTCLSVAPRQIAEYTLDVVRLSRRCFYQVTELGLGVEDVGVDELIAEFVLEGRIA